MGSYNKTWSNGFTHVRVKDERARIKNAMNSSQSIATQAADPSSSSFSYRNPTRDFTVRKPIQEDTKDSVPMFKGATHSKDAVRNNQLNSFRRTTRPLDYSDCSAWLDMTSAYRSLELESYSRDVVDVQDRVWEAFTARDCYFDIKKEYNTSNVEMLLKQKQQQNEVISSLAVYDAQIRRCVANPEEFPQTWNLLKYMYSEEVLLDYVEKKGYNQWELSSAKIDEDLISLLNINDDADKYQHREAQNVVNTCTIASDWEDQERDDRYFI